MIHKVLIDYWIDFVLSKYGLIYLKDKIEIIFTSKIKSLGLITIYDNDRIVIKLFQYKKEDFNLYEATETLVHELAHIVCFYLYGHVKHNWQMKEIMTRFSFKMD